MLYEYTSSPLVLNGWIFSAWGLLDYAKAFNDNEVREQWLNTAAAIAEYLPEFDCGYWSKYNQGKMMASPFYHKLHIAQLNVMYDLTGILTFKEYAERWQRFYDNRLYRLRAFVVKAMQKLKE